MVLRPLLLAPSSPPRPVLRCSVLRTSRTFCTLWFKRHGQRIRKQFHIIGQPGRKDLIHNEKRSIVRERDKSDIIILTWKCCQQRLKEKRHGIFINTQRILDFGKGHYSLCLKTPDRLIFLSIEKHRLQQTGNFCKQLVFFKFYKKHRLQQAIHEQFFKKHSHLQPSFFELQEFVVKLVKQQLVLKLQKQLVLFKQLQQKQFVEQFILPQQFFLIIRKLPQFGLILQRRQPFFRQQLILKLQKTLTFN